MISSTASEAVLISLDCQEVSIKIFMQKTGLEKAFLEI